MRIVHRISIASSPDVRRELDALGVNVVDTGLITFEVDEDHPAWPALRAWIARTQPVDVISTKFSTEELRRADWLALTPAWHHGYPQPDPDTFGYLETTYDRRRWCGHCGTGLVQKAPFCMEREPHWGRNGMLQLHWVFDEYFVTPEVWATVFEPYGVRCERVIGRRGGVLDTVVQLVVDAEVEIDTRSLVAEPCDACGRVKYAPSERGAFPALVSSASGAIAKTTTYFGSGAQAYRGVLISQALAQSLLAASVRGVSLRPVL